ncbi:MAG TPA: hypothetical protein VGS80_04100, partial [Ktedonobacterales bacterium]|nr:hypothetical protein [Ktedonobacterales bacterium]
PACWASSELSRWYQRLQDRSLLPKFIRGCYQRSPVLTTLLFAVVTLAYLILSNGTSLAAIILSQVHVWLATIAFAIASFAALGQVRASRRVGAGVARGAVHVQAAKVPAGRRV